MNWEDLKDRLMLIFDVIKTLLAGILIFEWSIRGIFYLVNKGIID